MPRYPLCPLACIRTIGPIHCPPVSCVGLTSDLGELIARVGLSRPDLPGVLPRRSPTTCCEAIAIAPSEVAVQFGPRLPSARLKLSDAITVSPGTPPPPLVVQVTATLVTLAEAIVPEPLATVQVCPDGLACTVTL